MVTIKTKKMPINRTTTPRNQWVKRKISETVYSCFLRFVQCFVLCAPVFRWMFVKHADAMPKNRLWIAVNWSCLNYSMPKIGPQWNQVIWVPWKEFCMFNILSTSQFVWNWHVWLIFFKRVFNVQFHLIDRFSSSSSSSYISSRRYRNCCAAILPTVSIKMTLNWWHDFQTYRKFNTWVFMPIKFAALRIRRFFI